TEFSGSQDSIGIVFPGLNRLDYKANYWPEKITSVHDEPLLHWIEQHLYLVTLGPRQPDFHVLQNTRISTAGAKSLAEAADHCWHAIKRKDLDGFGYYFRRSFEAQVHMFPGMMNDDIWSVIQKYRRRALGWKLSGAGGGGYLILVSRRDIPGASRITIRRNGL
ncbi:MAG: adenylyltransferase/cytidyltransferase family protein, partial [Limisphaerales bacterium]